MGRPPMGWAPAVFGRFLKPGGRGGRPKLEFALPTMPLVRDAVSLIELKRFEEAKGVLRKWLLVAQRVLGGSHELTLRMKDIYARTLYRGTGASLDDVREAVTTLEDTVRTARRVLGGAHPDTVDIEQSLRYARDTLRARKTRA